MGIKFGLSFVVKDEKERNTLREKFERHMGFTDSTKDHFERIVKYFNFHKDDIENAIEMEKRVIPVLYYRMIDNDRVKEFEIKNENFPASVTFYDKIYDLKANWFFQLKEFVKKYKIVNEPVFLNIDINTREVYFTIENIEKGDEKMAENKKRWIIGFNYYDEQERNRQKVRVEAMAKLFGTLNNGLDFMLTTTEMFLDKDGHINTELLENVKEASQGNIGTIIANMNAATEEAFQSPEYRADILGELYDRVHDSNIRIVVTGMPNNVIKEYVTDIPKDKGLSTYLSYDNMFTVSGCDVDKGNTFSISTTKLCNLIEEAIREQLVTSEGVRSYINMGLLERTVVKININYDVIARRSFMQRLFNKRPKSAVVEHFSAAADYGISITVNFN